MFKHVLIPTDGSVLSDLTVRNGLKLAKSLGARVTVLASSRPFRVVAAHPMMVSRTRDEYEKDVEVRTRACLELARDTARAASVRCDTTHVSSDHPHQAIIDTAQARDCDVVFMASPGREGLAAILLGSETQKVLSHCKLPVVLWR
jgi:nucleotide-binding universal stress UspA family protein